MEKMVWSQTISVLKNGGIKFFGANMNAPRARNPFTKIIFTGNKKVKLIVISVFEHREAYDIDFGFYAGRGKPGVNRLSISKIRDMIHDLRKSVLHDEVFVVIFPHWGGRRNYGWRTNSQRKMGHQLIEAGADLVIGHGPHNLQEIEEYEGRLIFYSIGNFVYNSLGGYNRYNVIPYSLAVKLTFRVEGTIPGELSSSHHTVGAISTGLKKLVKVYPILTEIPKQIFNPGY